MLGDDEGTAGVAIDPSPPVEPAPRRPRLQPVIAYAAGALVVCWLALIAGALFVAPREATLGRLESAVAAGQVDEVHIEGGIGRDLGSSTVEVHWRDGLFAYRTRLIEASSPREARASDPHGLPVLTGESISEVLRSLQPGVELHHGERGSNGITTEVLGRELGGGWAILMVGSLVATFVVLRSVPEPWRATRWAWFWLMLSPLVPVTAIAFLVFGGPLRLLPPRDGARRLTGGWAFLLSWFVLAGAFTDR